jgi:hypothetical protein
MLKRVLFELFTVMNVTASDSVAKIGAYVFYRNPLISVTVGADGTIDRSAFSGNFGTAYSSEGAGTYIRENSSDMTWTKRH